MKKNRKYPYQEEGKWLRVVQEGFKFCCCDCGLVHKMDFRIVYDGVEDVRIGEGRVEFRVFRDNRATGQVRRHLKNICKCNG